MTEIIDLSGDVRTVAGIEMFHYRCSGIDTSLTLSRCPFCVGWLFKAGKAFCSKQCFEAHEAKTKERVKRRICEAAM